MNKTSLKTPLSICILVLFHLTGFGQVIKGSVRNKETQEPLGYATVSVIGQNLRVITRSDGAFTLDVSRATATDSVSVSYIGYRTVNYALSDMGYPEVEAAVRIESSSITVRYEDDLISEPGFYKAGRSTFSVFSLAVIAGREIDALSEPNTVVLTGKLAWKYFRVEETPSFNSRNQTDEFANTGRIG